MCQVHGPSVSVQCPKCRAGYYEDSHHKCKVFKSFEEWDSELQSDAKRYMEAPVSDNSLINTMRHATIRVASWPKWKREWCWSDEYKYSVPPTEGGK